MRCIRILTLLSLVLGLLGCRDEVESSTYPMGQSGKTCTAYKGFDRHPLKGVLPSFPDGGWIVAG
ncbi:hypothetical protein BN1263550080 [Stenotrophomonas indicatrix]|jgi:hypothetical protein|nr:hypothetical protein BN1263550080 [Stenotrophomonas indicatrix]